jgi:type IV pilus assembly protein PilQ
MRSQKHMNSNFSKGRQQLFAPVRLAAILAGYLLALGGTNVFAQGSLRLEKMSATALAGDQVELRLELSDRAPQPVEFTVDNPARIVLDLPDTTSALTSRRIDVKRGQLDTVTVADAAGRTRIQLNLDSATPHETRVEGNLILVTVGAGQAGSKGTSGSHSVAAVAQESSRSTASTGGPRSLKNVDFRRGTDGSARIIVELSDSRVPADLRQEGGKVLVTFAKTALPDAQMKRLDVVDFATPVQSVDVVRVAEGARLVISANGDWEQIAYQSDNIYTVEIKPVVKLAPELQDKKEYTGERLNLSFQDIETRAVLQLLADTSGLNMVISDSVKGNVTLRLQDVPWDQALDVVMRGKGLDMRRDGNVLLVGPAAELAARDKELLAAKKEIVELAPLRMEYRQVNYAKASDLAALIKSKGSSLLSDRGNVTIDDRTNTLLLQDTAERLADIRRLISSLDIPVRQVQIEARIVIVNDDFSRELGARWGYTGVKANGTNGLYTVTGSAEGADTITSSARTNLQTTGSPFPVATPELNNRYMVNLPAANSAGRLALAVLGSDYMVDLELSAAEAEGRGEIVSSPRIITANQKEASIEQGVEIPYQESASSGATTVSFKKASLILKVKPQITPDNRIIMDLQVNKDSVGQNVPSGNGGFIPSIDTRQLSTQVLVNDGQTVVLGGILETEKTESQNKVPFLGDIPVLGVLFKAKTSVNNKRELLIFVTPKVLREGASIN